MPDELKKLDVIESYDLLVDLMKIEVNIVERPGEFVREYFLNFPDFGIGTKALLSEVRKSLVSEYSFDVEKLSDAAFLEKTKSKFRERAEKVFSNKMPEIESSAKNSLIVLLMQDMFGLGKIEFLLADSNLEEIVINDCHEPVWVYHKKRGWLKSNVFIETENDIENYSNIIARHVGKQITTLNPLLDAHLTSGDRANATLFPISTKGNTITIRRFRRDPWTVTDLIENKTASAELMALIWEAMEYELNIIISGGTASGKTSFLNVLMPFIQPNHRIISIEDSVLPETEIVCEKNGVFERTTVGDLVDTAIGNIFEDDVVVDNNFDLKLFSMAKDGKIVFAKPSKLFRHRVQKKVVDVLFESGKFISVTADHSLFALGEAGKIRAIAGNEIKKECFLAVPRILQYASKPVIFDLAKHLNVFEGAFLKSQNLSIVIQQNRAMLSECLSNCSINRAKRKGYIGAAMAADFDCLPENSVLSTKYGTELPLKVEIDETLATAIGLWLADGCYDVNSTLFSIVEPECRAIIETLSERFKANVKMHSDGITLMLNSKVLKTFFEEVLGLKGNAYTKRIPSWAFALPEKEAAALLRGYFSGDGWQRKYDVAVRSASMDLLKDVQTMLLRFGIVLRFKRKRLRDKTFESHISEVKNLKKFSEQIGFLQPKKMRKLFEAASKELHEVSDIVPLHANDYKLIKKCLKAEVGKRYTYNSWKTWGGTYKKGNISRKRLQELVLEYPVLSNFKDIAESDLIWEKVERVFERDYEGFVYDFSVPENESFVCNNIVCHNTRELTLPEFLHWVPLGTRSPNQEGKGEVSMLDLLVNSLRMRPDRLIIGEIRRQSEAEVMFEGMHTGHSVYTTFHANTADETIRRFTNPPVSIPHSMLESVHLNVVMFRNRRLGARRVLQVAEFIPEKRNIDEESIKANVLYRWRAGDDTVSKHGESIRLFDELSLHTGLSPSEINEELSVKQKILEWMVSKEIHDIRAVGKLMAEFYLYPDEIIKLAEKNLPPKNL